MLHHPFKRRCSSPGKRFPHEPIPHPHEVAGRRRQRMLERGLRLPEIACSSQPVGPHPLGDRSLNPCATGILRLLLGAGFSCSRPLQRHIILLGTHRERATLCPGSVCSARTGLAIRPGELDRHHLLVPIIDRGRPTCTQMPVRAGRLLLRPIKREPTGIKPVGRSSLPVGIGTRRAQQVHTVIAWPRHQERGVHLARIHNVSMGQPAFARKCPMNAGSHLIVGNRTRRGLHLRNEMRPIVVTGLGHMDFIAHPCRGLFLGGTGRNVIRRIDQLSRGRNAFLLGAPAHLA